MTTWLDGKPEDLLDRLPLRTRRPNLRGRGGLSGAVRHSTFASELEKPRAAPSLLSHLIVLCALALASGCCATRHLTPWQVVPDSRKTEQTASSTDALLDQSVTDGILEIRVKERTQRDLVEKEHLVRVVLSTRFSPDPREPLLSHFFLSVFSPPLDLIRGIGVAFSPAEEFVGGFFGYLATLTPLATCTFCEAGEPEGFRTRERLIRSWSEVDTRTGSLRVTVLGALTSVSARSSDEGLVRFPLGRLAIPALLAGQDELHLRVRALGEEAHVRVGLEEMLDSIDESARRGALADYGLPGVNARVLLYSVLAQSGQPVAGGALRRMARRGEAQLPLGREAFLALSNGQGVAFLRDGSLLDWSPGTPRGRPRPVVKAATTQAQGQPMLVVTVTNEGDGSLYQLAGILRSDELQLSGVPILFGRVRPGETVARELPLVPLDGTRSEEMRISLTFVEANGQGPGIVTSRLVMGDEASSGNVGFMPHYRRRLAVVIGVNDYRYWPRLEGAVGDGVRVANRLREYGFDEVVEVYDEEASRAQVLEVLGVDLQRKAHAEDLVLIYFAGHGQTETLPGGQKRGYVIPVDGDRESVFSSAISMDTLRELSNRIAAKHVYYVMDSCYSGLGLARGRTLYEGAESYVAKATSLRAVQMITAGQEGELARERGGEGVFTSSFLAAIDGEADRNWDGYVTATEIAEFVRRRVRSVTLGKQTPTHGTLEGEGEIVLTLP